MTQTSPTKLPAEINLAIGRLKNAAINYGEYRDTDRMNAMQEEDDALTSLLESRLKDSARIEAVIKGDWAITRRMRGGWIVEVGEGRTWDDEVTREYEKPALREALDAAISSLSGESSQ